MADLREITEQAAGIQQNTSSGPSIDNTLKDMKAALEDIESIMKGWKGGIPSLNNARTDANTAFRDRYNSRHDDRYREGSLFDEVDIKRRRKGFMDSFEDELLDGFLGANFKKEVRGVFSEFAKQLNVNIKDIPGELGKQLGKTAMSAIKKSTSGQKLMSQVDQLKKNLFGNLQTKGSKIIDNMMKGQGAGQAAAGIDKYLGPITNAHGGPVRAFGQGAVAGVKGLGGMIKGGFSLFGQAKQTMRELFSTPQPEADVREESMSESASKQEIKETTLAKEAVKDSKESISNVKETESKSVVAQVEESDLVNRAAEAAKNAGQESAQSSGSDIIGSITKTLTGGEGVPGLDGLTKAFQGATTSAESMSAANAVAASQTAAAGAEVVTAGVGAGEAAGALALLGPEALAVVGALLAIEVVTDKFTQAFKDFTDGISRLWNAWKNAANRDQKQREANLQAARDRMKADYETMVRAPFELLEEAANSLYSAWNSNLTTVSATQGYTKADVQDLMAAYAERIRQEGLSSYIDGSNLFNNLARVLDSGLSGKVAEEFAYQATVLGKAIPTQDFFSYASTYASVAANAIREGMTQQDAIAKANATLNEFASSLLYTSRELTGGFTTGLKDAQSIYAESSKIALAAQSDNQNAISSVLLAIQGYVGAVAPDIADALTNTIYTLATGGNSSTAVALRSLAGGNASNTEFLKSFAENPQAVIATMFDNLSAMYSSSSDAYMEKAEGYAELFGLSSEAFQRIDFSDLANTIRGVNLNNGALDENMAMLESGETTTTAEQLKAQQINQYMIDEGLAYLIDNEVAQQIQQHMWQEQIAREIVQSNFSVDLVGESAEGMQKIIKTVQRILDFLNPFSWLKKITNVIGTEEEAVQQSADIAKMLELGKVGTGRQLDFYRLTHYNEDLKMATPIVDLLGGKSSYNYGSKMKEFDKYANPLLSAGNMIQVMELQEQANMMSKYATGGMPSPQSRYSWGTTSKTQGQASNMLIDAFKSIPAELAAKVQTSAQGGDVTAGVVKESLSKMMDQEYIKNEFVKQGKTFEDWKASASEFGIADLEGALKSAGFEESDVEQYFADIEENAGLEAKHDRDMKEEHFWDVGTEFWETKYWDEYTNPLFEKIDLIQETLNQIQQNQIDWATYFNSTWTNWLNVSWYKDWIADSWRSQWLQKAWDTKWLNKAWNEQWVEALWGEKGDWTNRWTVWNDAWLGEKGWMPGDWTYWFGEDGQFSKLYTTITDYMLYRAYYGVASEQDVETSKLLQKLEEVQADTKAEDRKSVAYGIGKVLADTMIDENSKDPALQTNILLGQIVVYLGQIVQQTVGTSGGSALVETLSAMALGLTTQTP